MNLMNRFCLIALLLVANLTSVTAQTSFNRKFSKSNIYVGIEIGSKGVKMSVVEIGKNSQSNGEFHVLKDTSVNTDFITFTQATFDATINGLASLYNVALNDYKVPAKRIFTVISSGVKMQAEKDKKTEWISNFISVFQQKIGDPGRKVDVIDVREEARLSHLGIVPNNRRYSTFLIDIGSGNTKGGYFPYGNTTDFKLFQLNWGTKSTTNAAEKALDEDKSLANYQNKLKRVLDGAEQTDIIYAVNYSGAYPLSDNIAFSGGIAWSVATLVAPEMIGNSVVTLSYDDVYNFSQNLFKDFASLSPEAIVSRIKDPSVDKEAVLREAKRVHGVFDQKALMGGTGLLLKIMRQFKSVYESKQFYFVKNGQVGWISAYVDEAVE